MTVEEILKSLDEEIAASYKEFDQTANDLRKEEIAFFLDFETVNMY
jgi:hypothetical protein